MIFQRPIQKRNAFEQPTDFYFLTDNVGTFKDSMLYYFNTCTYIFIILIVANKCTIDIT